MKTGFKSKIWQTCLKKESKQNSSAQIPPFWAKGISVDFGSYQRSEYKVRPDTYWLEPTSSSHQDNCWFDNPSKGSRELWQIQADILCGPSKLGEGLLTIHLVIWFEINVQLMSFRICGWLAFPFEPGSASLSCAPFSLISFVSVIIAWKSLLFGNLDRLPIWARYSSRESDNFAFCTILTTRGSWKFPIFLDFCQPLPRPIFLDILRFRHRIVEIFAFLESGPPPCSIGVTHFWHFVDPGVVEIFNFLGFRPTSLPPNFLRYLAFPAP